MSGPWAQIPEELRHAWPLVPFRPVDQNFPGQGEGWTQEVAVIAHQVIVEQLVCGLGVGPSDVDGLTELVGYI